ncbi:MAG: SDR family NAD(P)-dependent oxidoreductase [Acidimicrobiaceae bacterium]|nr:SDR family NAD(P)-dependent oxidoreductase [Acidimicrobiaceae bacterium]
MAPTSLPLDGRRVLITGATSGLGQQLASLAALRGADVIVAVRSPERAERTRLMLEDLAPRGTISTVHLDLTSFDSVQAALAEIHERWDSLDVVVNNAGVMAIDEALGPDGFDLTMTVNHLSATLLSVGVIDLLERSSAPRLTFTSSVVHWLSRLRPGLLGEAPSPYRRWVAYARSKEANLATALELDRRARDANSPLTILCAHPGVAATHLGHEGHGLSNLVMRSLGPHLLPTAQQGAASLAEAAFTDSYPGGSFVGPSGLFAGSPHRARVSAYAADPRHGREVLDRTLALIDAQLVFNLRTS